MGLDEDGGNGRGQRGQASVEYALVLLAFVASFVALAAIWHAARDGLLLERARDAASHSFASGLLDASKDFLLY